MIFRRRPLHNTSGRGTIGFVQRNGRPEFNTSTVRHFGTSALRHLGTSSPRHFDTSAPQHLTGVDGMLWEATDGHRRPREAMAAIGRHGRPREDASSFRHLDTSTSLHFSTSAPRHVRGCFCSTFLESRSMIAQGFSKVLKPLQNQISNQQFVENSER